MIEKQKTKFDGIAWVKEKGICVDEIKIRKMDLKELKNKVALNAGCSSKFETYHFAQFFKQIHGIDISEKNIREANEKYKAKNLFFELGDVEQLPFKNSTFDIVYARWVIEHLKSPQKFIDESYRILKDNGILILVAPNEKSMMGFMAKTIPLPLKVKVLKMLQKSNEVSHHKCYYRANTVQKLDKLCRGKFKRIYLEYSDGDIIYCRNYRILTYLWFLKHKLTNNKLLSWTQPHFYVEYKKLESSKTS